MKKRMITGLLAVLLALLLAAPTAAAAGAAGQAAEAAGQAAEAAVQEETVEQAETERAPSVAEQLADVLLPHLSDLAVALAAVWLAFPKWGGVAVVTRLLRRIHTYFDDANNSRSVYNLLSANADAISRFMNDAAPLLSDLREGRQALEQAQAALTESEALADEQKELLRAARAELSLLTAELWRVVSALPTTDEQTRARFAALFAATEGEETHERSDANA